MVDVFCLALLVVTVKLGGLADVTVRRGFWLFTAGVALSLCLSWQIHKPRRQPGADAARFTASPDR